MLDPLDPPSAPRRSPREIARELAAALEDIADPADPADLVAIVGSKRALLAFDAQLRAHSAAQMALISIGVAFLIATATTTLALVVFTIFGFY